MARPPRTKLGRTENGIADAAGDHRGLGRRAGDAVGGLLDGEFLQQGAELLAVAGDIQRFDGCAEDRNAGFLETAGEIQRRLAAELDR